jgi:hypothetical protein
MASCGVSQPGWKSWQPVCEDQTMVSVREPVFFKPPDILRWHPASAPSQPVEESAQPPRSRDAAGFDSIDKGGVSDIRRGADRHANSIDVPVAELKRLAESHRSTRNETLGRRSLRIIALGVLLALVGAAVTWVWQYPGGDAKQVVRNWVGSSGTSSSESMASNTLPQPALTAPTVPPPPELLDRLETVVRDLSLMRGTVEQLAARQEQMAQEIAALQAAEQDIKLKVSSPPTTTVVAPRGKPARIFHQRPNVQVRSTEPAPVPSPVEPQAAQPLPPPPAAQPSSGSPSEPVPRPPAPMREDAGAGR